MSENRFDWLAQCFELNNIQVEEILNILVTLLGGLGLFLFGMKHMSDNLRNVTSNRLRGWLEKATDNRVKALIAGTLITCLIQSSSATTVMTVGLVNAGLLTLKQSLGVILGANIGTTVTGWLVSLTGTKMNFKFIALFSIGIGFILTKAANSPQKKNWGHVLFGFGLIFLGLVIMKDASTPLKHSAFIKDFFATFASSSFVGTLLGVVFGTIFTILLQSSSATIAIVQLLASTGVISFAAAIPVVLGDNIGTTITAEIASHDGRLNARRTARAHSLFNIIGVLFMFIPVWLGWYGKLINYITPGNNVMFNIAVSHTVFNVLNASIFLVFIKWLEKMAIKVTPKREGEIEQVNRLDANLLKTPDIALNQVRLELLSMLKMARGAVRLAVESFDKNDDKAIARVKSFESDIDDIHHNIGDYLQELMRKFLTPVDSQYLRHLIEINDDVERLGDIAENIINFYYRKRLYKLDFSEDAIREMREISQSVLNMFEAVIEAMETSSVEKINIAKELEREIDVQRDTFRMNHDDRLANASCVIHAGTIFVEFLQSIERIGDHLFNIVTNIEYSLNKES